MKQISIIVLVLISLLLVGCSSQETMPETTPVEGNSGEVVDDNTQEVVDQNKEVENTSADENQVEQGSVDSQSGVDRVIEIDAFNFGYSEEEIRVKQGETVRIIMTSTDGTHDFVVDELNIQSGVISTNGVTEVEFEATQTGVYEFYCSIGSHRQAGMFGTLIIEE